jgi:alkylation response protein AidB-like acyl-CoA dehydrogenase
MQWKLSEEQDAYREALRGWLGDVAPPDRVRNMLGVDGDEPDLASFEQRFVTDGMAGVGVAEELGGQGGGLVELSLTAEELGRSGAPSAAWLATVLAMPALEGRADVAKAAITGGHAALLLPADDVPDEPAGLVAVDPDGRLTGTIPRVLGADRASLLVAAVADGDALELRLVESGAEGVTVTPRPLLDRSRSVADVRLDGAPSVALEVDAVASLSRAADLAAVLVAADALGAMERVMELAVEYSGQRHQFGVPIGSFQAVKHAAASILVDVEAGRSGIYYAAASVEAGAHECALHAAAVKAQVTAAAVHAADTGLTMHGAIGYTWEHDLHLHYKRAKLDEHLFGGPAVWNERIAAGLDLVAGDARDAAHTA